MFTKLHFLALTAMAWLATATPAGAVTCQVPSVSFPTIQSALDDVTCTEVELAAGQFLEAPSIGHSVTLRGAGSLNSTILGQVSALGGSISLEGFTIQTGSGVFNDALLVDGTAEVNGFDLVVINGGGALDLIFADGFEGGD
jgi:hypothetical protein